MRKAKRTFQLTEGKQTLVVTIAAFKAGSPLVTLNGSDPLAFPRGGWVAQSVLDGVDQGDRLYCNGPAPLNSQVKSAPIAWASVDATALCKLAAADILGHERFKRIGNDPVADFCGIVWMSVAAPLVAIWFIMVNVNMIERAFAELGKTLPPRFLALQAIGDSGLPAMSVITLLCIVMGFVFYHSMGRAQGIRKWCVTKAVALHKVEPFVYVSGFVLLASVLWCATLSIKSATAALL